MSLRNQDESSSSNENPTKPKPKPNKGSTINLQKLDLEEDEEEVLRQCVDICKLAVDAGNRKEIKERILKLFEFFMDNSEESDKEECLNDTQIIDLTEETKKRKFNHQ